MESVLIVGLVTIVFGFLIMAVTWDAYASRNHRKAIRARWRRSKRDILFAPVITQFYGDKPRTRHTMVRPESGVLGIADGALVFIRRFSEHERAIPFEHIHHVGNRPIVVQQGKHTARKQALIVHYERGGRWRVGAWILTRDLVDLTRVLRAQVRHNTPYMGPDREDFGPMRAERLKQDIYGQWNPFDLEIRPYDPDDPLPASLSEADLYLAPDRLLFDCHDAVLLSQMRRVEVYEKGGPLHELNPFREDLLRIEYETPDGERDTVGFEVRRAERWGREITKRAGIPFQVHEGRKKKGG